MRIVALALSVFFSSLLFAQNIHPVFNTDKNTSIEMRSAAFANWWYQNVPTDLEEATEYLKSLGVNLNTWMKSANMEYSQDELDVLFVDLYFFQEQPGRFKDKIYRWVEDASAKFPAAWDKMTSTRNAACILMYTEKADSLVLRILNTSTDVLKLRSVLHGEALSPTSPFVVLKKNGKPKKAKVETSLQQSFKWNGGETTLQVMFKDLQTAFIAINKRDEKAPFIKEYYVNDDEIFEGQKVTLTWYVLGCEKVNLDQGIGEHKSKWQVMIAPEDTTTYTLVATNAFGTSTKDLTVYVERTVVESMVLTFFTPEKGDPKNLGTPILLEVIDKHNEVVAHYGGLEQMEISGVTPYVGPFTLEQNEIILKKDFTKAFLKFSIPEGGEYDKYTFSPIVIIKFSNGSKHELYGFGNKEIETGGEPVMIQFSTY